MEMDFPTRLSRDLVDDLVAGLARPMQFAADALAAAEKEEMSPKVREDVSAVVLGQEEVADPGSGLSGDPQGGSCLWEVDEDRALGDL